MGILQVLRLEFQKFRILKILNFHPCACVFPLQVEIDSLIQCREQAGQLLKGKNMLPTGYVLKSHLVARTKSVKRKAVEVDVEDDLYDGIKRLYNDDPPSMVKSMSCGSELGQEVDNSAGSYNHVQPVSAN